jgi:RNA 2',3'-cyclic 3'-phosphodiesterase
MPERRLRLFIALWPENDARETLLHAAQAVLTATRGRLVTAENLHVTLVFVGSVGESRVQELSAAIATVAALPHRLPIELVFEHLEHWKKARVLCATTTQTPSCVSALAATLKERLVATGFSPDLKPFRAHVTLARKVAHPTTDRPLHKVLWRFTAIALVSSHTGPSGASYSVLERWTLCSEGAENI